MPLSAARFVRACPVMADVAPAVNERDSLGEIKACGDACETRRRMLCVETRRELRSLAIAMERADH